MTIWFTADTHFGHENIITLSHRPFASLEDMHAALITNWNSIVRSGDIVYHLGDFAISWGRAKSAASIDAILQKLNGQKWLITGNHDREEVERNSRWVKVVPYHELKVDLGGEHKQRIVLCHYAMRVWNQMHRGAWMLHGHSHGSLPDIGGKILDVGVDAWLYTPISLEVIASVMDRRAIVTCDHHVME